MEGSTSSLLSGQHVSLSLVTSILVLEIRDSQSSMTKKLSLVVSFSTNLGEMIGPRPKTAFHARSVARSPELGVSRFSLLNQAPH